MNDTKAPVYSLPEDKDLKQTHTKQSKNVTCITKEKSALLSSRGIWTSQENQKWVDQ